MNPAALTAFAEYRQLALLGKCRQQEMTARFVRSVPEPHPGRFGRGCGVTTRIPKLPEARSSRTGIRAPQRRDGTVAWPRLMRDAIIIIEDFGRFGVTTWSCRRHNLAFLGDQIGVE
jgi:hypothetical protein